MAQSVDVLVVGAGAAGLVCAGMLAQRGARVQILNDNHAAPPASAAAAGMLAPVSEALLARHDIHPLALALGQQSLRLWGEMAGQLPIGFRRAGTLIRAEVAAGADLLHAALSAGGEASPCNDGVFLAEEALLDPRGALRALRNWALGLGVSERADAPVVEILSEPGRVVGLRLADRSVACAQSVVLATGVWANAGLRNAAPALNSLQPARGCLVEFETAREESGPMLRAEGVYLVPQPGGRLLAGASMEFGVASPLPDAGQLALLRDRAIAIRPDLERAPWSGRAGVRAMSPDWSPLFGPTGIGGLFLAAGMGRNGWLLAPIAGQILCSYVFGDALAPLHAAFSPDRFGLR